MRSVLWLTVVGCLCVAGFAAVFEQAGADETDRVLLQSNVTPAFEKLGRGFSNTVGGWLEVPYQIEQRYTRGDTAGSLFAGTLIGLAKGVVRTVVGVYETVTFWLPLPEHFAPILPTLPYFNKAESRQPLLLE